jgi:ATP-dependent Clp protease ATP-binding subunit ClpC
MQTLVNGAVDVQVFDTDVRNATHDWVDVLAAAVRTNSPRIESTHILISLIEIRGGATLTEAARLGISKEDWLSGLAACARSGAGSCPTDLNAACLDGSTLSTLTTAGQLCSKFGLVRINEQVLLLAALHHLTAGVETLFKGTDIDVQAWKERIKRQLEPVTPIEPFSPDEKVVLSAFSPGGRKVLNLMRTEAESLGYGKIDSRYLLLGLLEVEGGCTQYALFHQGLAPKKLQEATLLSLRGGARKTRSVLSLDREHLQTMVQRTLTVAGELAGRDHHATITEPHILRAALKVEGVAQRILLDEKVNINTMREVAEGFEIGEEKEDDSALADIATVRKRLLDRLVGQGDTVEHILPYIQRMRFGFTSQGRPVGTFLFCGQSGSGKTEMAKELARAVYGSEENLIFLEMGQFNSPESMNIFVGAPPGYVGYGEGKLTNGLRDKPRSVVLFDEVEKAHPRVLDALLRFLDEGRIDDPAGPVRDGSQCLVILTSNVGAVELSELSRQIANDPANRRSLIRKKLREEFQKHKFRIEFLNRLDEVILFHTLAEADYAEIARRLMRRELDRLAKERQITVKPDEGVAEAIAAYCAAANEGARAVRRLIEFVVITPVIDFVLANNCNPPVSLHVKAKPSGDPQSEPQGEVTMVSVAVGV